MRLNQDAFSASMRPSRSLRRVAALASLFAVATCKDAAAPLPASKLSFVVQPGAVAAGVPISPALQVAVQDANGTTVTSAATSITISITSGAGATSAVLGGTLVQSAVNGVATFANVTIDKAGAAYSITATAPNAALSSTTSTAFTVSAGVATQIASNAGSTTGAAGASVATPPSVIVKDAPGNPVVGVSVTFAVSAGGGSITGGTQVTNVSGIATVGSWTLGTAAALNVLTATAPGLAGSPVTISVASTGGPGSGWSSLQPMLTPRRNFGATSVGGVLYVMGGFGAESSTESYNVASNSWSALPAMPTPRRELAAATVNGIVYAIGGADAAGQIFATTEAFNPATGTWTSKASMPTARNGLVVVSANAKIYAIGGSGGMSILEIYDPVSNSWSTGAPMPTGRVYAAAAVSDGIIYVTGGRSAAGTNYIGTVEAYNPASNTWTTKAAMPTGRQWHAMATLNGLVYSIAGYNGPPSGVQLSSVEVYDPIGDRWTTATSIPTWRLYLSAVTIGQAIFAVGGYNTVAGVESLLNTLEVFRP